MEDHETQISEQKTMVDSDPQISESSNSLVLRMQSMMEFLTRSGEGDSTRRQPNLVGHIALTAVLLGLIVGGVCVLRKVAIVKTNDWALVADQTPLPGDLAQGLDNQIPEGQKKVTASELTRIEAQFQEVQNRMRTHYRVMVYFNQQYFVSLSMASFLGVIAGICIFFVSNKGWEKSSNWLINTFVVMASCALLFQQFPGLFMQSQNLENNEDLYVKYVDLQNDILSYIATRSARGTGDGTVPNSVPSPSDFILDVDNELLLLNQIPIDFDANRIININDFSKQLRDISTPSETPSPEGDSQ